MKKTAIVALSLVAGCGGSSGPSDAAIPVDASPPADVTLTSGGATLVVHARPFGLELRTASSTVARTLDPALEVGTLATPNPHLYPDPLFPGNGVTYSKLTEVTGEAQSGDGWTLAVATADAARTVTFSVTPEGDGSFAFSATPAPADGVVHVRLHLAAAPDEHFFGFGEYFDTVDQRGQVRDVRFVLDTTIESGYNEVHVPVNSYVSTTGFALFLDNREPLVADMAKTDANVHLTEVAGDLRGHLVAAASPVAAVARVQRIAGLPPLWPPWMFAPIQWRDEDPVVCTVSCDQGCKPSSTGSDVVLADVKAMRKLKLPGSLRWIDAPWMSGFDNFEFNTTQFPDPKGLIDQLQALGYEVAVWAAPFINVADDRGTECGILPPPTGGLYNEALAKGYFVKQPNGQPELFPWRGSMGALVDFTNPDAVAFWKSLVKKTTDLGIRGYKLDWDEYVVAAIGPSRFDLRFFDGTTPATEHAVHHELWHKAQQEALVEAGGPGFLLSRSGDSSDGQYTTVWPGDLDADLSRFRSAKTADGLDVVGGLPSAVNAAVSLAASAHPHFGSDIGGLRHAPASTEAMARWVEFGALSTIMQVRGESRNFLHPDQPDFDQQVLDVYAKYSRLHLSLFPYLYAYAKRNSVDGTPILRAPALQYPGDSALAAAPFEYFVGDDLLVAPVVTAGATARMVTLPEGQWVNWWTNEVVTGPAVKSVEAPLDTLPLFVRAGAVIPLMPDDVDTLTTATDPSVVTLEMRKDQLWMNAYPAFDGQQRSFTLADGTALGLKTDPVGIVLSVAGAPLARTYSVTMSVKAALEITRANGDKLPLLSSLADYEEAGEGAYSDGKVLRIRFKAMEDTITVRLPSL